MLVFTSGAGCIFGIKGRGGGGQSQKKCRVSVLVGKHLKQGSILRAQTPFIAKAGKSVGIEHVSWPACLLEALPCGALCLDPRFQEFGASLVYRVTGSKTMVIGAGAPGACLQDMDYVPLLTPLLPKAGV